MLMIPITFLPATILLIIAVWLTTRHTKPLRAPWLIAFLFSLTLQFALLGLRYGYGVEGILAFQHLTGVIIPPLSFLAFTNPIFSRRVALHILPVAIMALATHFSIYLMDVILALITFGYAIGLVFAVLKDSEVVSWAPLRYEQTLRLGLWVTIATLMLSGITDTVIAADFLMSGGLRTNNIAAVASLAGLILLALGVLLLLRNGLIKQPISNSAEDQALVQQLTEELKRKELFRDHDLTLSRLAKRLSVPARQISQAINRSTGLNVSQFVNNIRISATCDLLITKDISITSAMLETGFYTKSNFNREFLRVTGQSPTKWLSAQTMKKDLQS